MEAIDINKVEKVYSGAASCMCGCKGKWSYNSNVEGIQSYQTVNPRSVKIIVGKVSKHPDRKDEGDMSFVEIPETGRILAVYYKKNN